MTFSNSGPTYLFVSGMFRSGTTLLARMLNVHQNIACASDPMRPIFNSFRYTLADETYRQAHQRFDPLWDYFLKETSLFARILAADLNIVIDADLPQLHTTIKESAMEYSGLWARSLPDLRLGMTYADAIQLFLQHIKEVYGTGRDIQITAFKEVWTNEFIPAFLRTFPGSKALILVRDPRAVAASNNVTSAKYPIIFMARQWRKLAFLSQCLVKDYPQNVLVLRYEDLVQAPEESMRQSCTFLDLPFDLGLLEGDRYVDGDLQPWQQNTNYTCQGAKEINQTSLTKWQKMLDETDIRLIELIAADLMQTFNYTPQYNFDELLTTQIQQVKRLGLADLAKWIRPYSFDENDETFETMLLLEKIRLAGVRLGLKLTSEEKLRIQVF